MADQAAEGLFSPFLRRRRLSAVAAYLKGRVLDVGCGSGAMAALVSPGRYLGVEIDPVSLEQARTLYPEHQFQLQMPAQEHQFDTVAALAVIEHVKDPTAFLTELGQRMNPGNSSRVVVTTPHPSMDWIHSSGAALGLFSRHADEEHEDLLDRARLESAGAAAGLYIDRYRRFLLGANQLAVFALSEN